MDEDRRGARGKRGRHELANVGQLDIVAALQWVRDNIANFGGDPRGVLIFGQSGGGGKVGTLTGMPSAKGLFQRASIQSGSGVRRPAQDRSAELTAAGSSFTARRSDR